MQPLKQHLPIEKQIEKLKSRGLNVGNEQYALQVLSSVNYYRLTGYLHDFKIAGSDKYVNGLSFNRVKRIYDFDRKLTRVLLYALEDIEETFKTRLSYTLSSAFPDNPTIYLTPYPYREYDPYLRFLAHFYKAVEDNCALPFVKHHINIYGGFLPVWVAVELMTMGNLQAIYANLLPVFQKKLARQYSTGPMQLKNWLQNLTYFRNHLAHYMRVYNYNFGRTPMRCRYHHAQFYSPTNKVFDFIFITRCLYSDDEDWNGYIVPDLRALIDEYCDEIELSALGFPDTWEDILRK